LQTNEKFLNELIWREFYQSILWHFPEVVSRSFKPKYDNIIWRNNEEAFKSWCLGQTGYPIVDAGMRELNATGWMSNRGRQNVASFLVKDLKVNWQMGAEYFESLLIDYDPCSNWGNWNYVAGIGSDLREDRYFNILTQARNYDPRGEYVRLWCPELQNVPLEKIHRPDLLSAGERQEFKVNGYPKAMVRIEKWAV
jgi:deoxyribodipyrimidine photo-lyase